MTRPTSGGQRPAPAQAALSASLAGAVDLSGLAQRATQSAAAAAAPTPQSSVPAAPGEVLSTDGAAAKSPYVVDVTEETFQTVVEASTRVLVVIDLWATWCEPCKQLSPVLEKLAAEAGGSWILAKVDVDANPRIAQAFGVQSIPTVVAIAAGQPLDAFAGVQPEPQLRQWLSGLLDSVRDKLPGIALAEEATGGPVAPPPDPRFTAAEDLMAHEQFGAAVTAYQKILDVEPANAEAAAGRAAAVFYDRVQKLPAAAVAIADAAPEDVSARKNAADAELAAGDPAAAFFRLIAGVKTAAGDDRTELREHLVGLFALFAAEDPEVVAARRSLAAALY